MNKTLLSYILVVGICAVAGAGTGVILKRTVGPIDETYPPGFSPEEYLPDMDGIMSRYNSLSDQSISGVRNFSDAEVANIVMEKYRQQEYAHFYTIGTAYTIITQTIRNAFIKNGDNYFEEQISYSSLVNVAKRSLQTGIGGDVTTYNGTANGSTNATYPSEPTKTFTASEYKNFMGKTLDEMFIYIISDKTVVNSTRVISGDEVKINFELNPNLSTFYYKTQMVNLSGLSNLPPFTEIKLVYTFTSDLQLTHIYADETFTATKEGVPVPAETHNVMDIYYYQGEAKTIPASNESIDYSILEE